MREDLHDLRERAKDAAARRNSEIVALAAGGHTQQEIANKFGITRQRANQIIRRESKKSCNSK